MQARFWRCCRRGEMRIFEHGPQRNSVGKKNGDRPRWSPNRGELGTQGGLKEKVVVGKERSLIKPSLNKNRKKKADELDSVLEDRPLKRQVLGDLNALVSVPVEAAAQPHRAL